MFDDMLCKSIWDDANVGYSFQPSLGASSGFVTLWDSSQVEVWSTTSFDHVFNIYAPCDVSTGPMSNLLCSIFMHLVMFLVSTLFGLIFPTNRVLMLIKMFEFVVISMRFVVCQKGGVWGLFNVI